MKYAIVHLYHHNNWANSRLLDFVEAQAPALLEETIPGSYGTIGETLVHLVAAQERYAVRLTGQKRREPVKESEGWRGFKPLRTSLEWSGLELANLAEKTPADPYQETEYEGRPVKLMYATVLTQVNQPRNRAPGEHHDGPGGPGNRAPRAGRLGLRRGTLAIKRSAARRRQRGGLDTCMCAHLHAFRAGLAGRRVRCARRPPAGGS